MRSTLIPAAIILIFAAQLPSQQPAATVDYAKQVQPIFNTCAACHIGSAASAGLHLDTAAGALAGSNAGRVIIPGNSKGSLLVQRISDTTGNQMPPSDMLSKEQIKLITRLGRSGREARCEPAPPRLRPSLETSLLRFRPSLPPRWKRTISRRIAFTCHSGPYAKAGLETGQATTRPTSRRMPRSGRRWFACFGPA